MKHRRLSMVSKRRLRRGVIEVMKHFHSPLGSGGYGEIMLPDIH